MNNKIKCTTYDDIYGKVIHFKLNNLFHNNNGPALIIFYKNGNKKREEYYINGIRHNENGPSIIHYYENGNIQCEEYYIDNKLHNETGPACIYYSYEFRNMKIYEEYWVRNIFVPNINNIIDLKKFILLSNIK